MYNNIKEMLDDVCEKYSERIAFKIDNGKTYKEISYKKLHDDVYNIAGFLQKQGYIKNRIAIIGNNSYEWIVVYLATLCAGGVVVPLDNGLFEEEVLNQISRSEAKTIFCSKKHFSYLEKSDTDAICMGDDFWDRVGECEFAPAEIDRDIMSILLFTSGTTSKSKAVMLSQKNILFDAEAMRDWETFYPDDISIAVLPLHHTFGMMETVLFLMYGMQNVILGNILHFQKVMRECGVTSLVAVPRLHNMVKDRIIKTMKEQNKTKQFNRAVKLSSILLKLGIDIRRKLFHEIISGLGNLRVIVNGAAPANPETFKFFNDIGIVAISGYGLTETSSCAVTECESCSKRGSVGKPLPGTKMKIVDKDENGIGEILVSGDNVMCGYYQDEDETARVFDGEWFRTGDVGYIDNEGFLFITGRKKYVIVLSTGENVFPEEIEFLIEQCDAVKESVVYKDNDNDRLYAKVVYENYDEEIAEELIKNHISKINEKLPQYKQIRNFKITDKEFEKTTTLKIKRDLVAKESIVS